jgi:glucokinase
MTDIKIIGIDLGATNIRGAVVTGNTMGDIISRRINTKGTEKQVLEDVYFVVDKLMGKDVKAIGIGVPSVVDVELGIV